MVGGRARCRCCRVGGPPSRRRAAAHRVRMLRPAPPRPYASAVDPQPPRPAAAAQPVDQRGALALVGFFKGLNNYCWAGRCRPERRRPRAGRAPQQPAGRARPPTLLPPAERPWSSRACLPSSRPHPPALRPGALGVQAPHALHPLARVPVAGGPHRVCHQGGGGRGCAEGLHARLLGAGCGCGVTAPAGAGQREPVARTQLAAPAASPHHNCRPAPPCPVLHHVVPQRCTRSWTCTAACTRSCWRCPCARWVADCVRGGAESCAGGQLASAHIISGCSL